jgi:hypothetical protein
VHRRRQGVRVDHDDCVELRASLAVSLDAIEIHLDQLAAGGLMRRKAARISAIVASSLQLRRKDPALLRLDAVSRAAAMNAAPS